VLLIHHDAELLDQLTRLFESRGLAVATAVTSMQAMAQLQAERDYDVVIASWDANHGLGGVVYRWVLRNRPALRGQFVFLADETAPEFDRWVAGRCLTVPPGAIEEIVRVADAAVRRREQVRQSGDEDLVWLDHDRPTLLLADDDPMILSVMARLLGDVGFAVTAVEGGNPAITRLDHDDYDVIVVDWHMADGSGAEVYQWIMTFRPWLSDRVVFISGASPRDIADIAPGRPAVPKGQDSPALIKLLTGIARASRQATR